MRKQTVAPPPTLSPLGQINLPDGLLKIQGGTLFRALPGVDYLTSSSDGSLLTNLNASSISSGLLAVELLPVVDWTHGGLGSSDILLGVLKGNALTGYSGGATTSDVPEGTNKYWTDARFELALSANGVAYDLQVVHLSGAETIGGVKTFVDAAVFNSSVSAASFIGSGANLTNLNASSLATGQVAASVLGSGNATNSTYLRGDGTWAAISVGAAGAGGDNTQLQYNSAGVLTGAAGLTWDATGNRLILTASGSQSSNLLEWRDDGGFPVTYIGPDSHLYGSGAQLVDLNASQLSFGTVDTARLGSGTASALTFLRGDGSWDTPQGVPGGADQQIQFNQSGGFGASPGFTFDYGTNTLSISQPSLTVASAPVIQTLGTWNEFGVTFTNWLSNVADTASSAASLLLDLQVNSSSKFNVDKFGNTKVVGTVTASAVITAGLAVSGTLTVNDLGVLGALSAFSLSASSATVTGNMSVSGNLVAGDFIGSGSGLINLNADSLSSGLVVTGVLGTGSAGASTFLRGDSSWSSDGSQLVNLNASNLSSGIAPVRVLGTGIATNSTFLRGDGTWATVSVGAAGAGGDDTQLQYNSAGVLTGAAGLTWDAIGNRLILTASGSQSSNLLEWRDTGGTPVTFIGPDGLLNGSGVNLTSLNATNLSSGTVGTARLGSGTASSGTMLLGNNTWSANGSFLTSLNASNLSTGTVPTAQLGSGTASSSTFLRGDGAWAVPAGGGGGGSTVAYGAGASRPAPGNAGNIYIPSDGVITSVDTGAAWVGLNPFGAPLTIPPTISNWTVLSSAAVATDVPGGGIQIISNSVGAFKILQRTISNQASYSAVVAFTMATISNKFTYAGIMMSDGTKTLSFAVGPTPSVSPVSGALALQSDLYTDRAFSGGTQNQGFGFSATGPLVWLRVRNNGTIRFYEFSSDGVLWNIAWEDSTSNGLTESTIGPYAYSGSSNITATLVHWSGV